MGDYLLVGSVFKSSHIDGAFQFWHIGDYRSLPGHSSQTLFQLLDLIPQGNLVVLWCLGQPSNCAICVWRSPGTQV